MRNPGIAWRARVVAVGVITAALAACEPVIEPVELPLNAALLAEDGSVVGTQADGGPYSYSPPAGSEVTIVRWDDGVVEELASLGHATEVEVTAHNRAGDIVGQFVRDQVRQAFLLTNDGQLQVLASATSPGVHVPRAIDAGRRIVLTPHPGYGTSYSSTQIWDDGIASWPWLHAGFDRSNEAGLAVGAVGASSGKPSTWATGSPWPVSFSDRVGSAQAVNEKGTVAGTVLRPGTNQRVAYLWKGSALVELPTPPGGQQVTMSRAPGSLNEHDEVVGTVTLNGAPRAVLWREGEAVDLGTLAGGTVSRAAVVNESSQVAGISDNGDAYHGFLWKDGQMTDLGPAEEILGLDDDGAVLGRTLTTSLYWPAP
jgi:probable HAF family extracellular repeat protein